MTEAEKLAQLEFTDPQQMREALEHAKAALASDNEGVRLWMLDCGELVAKHRARAEATEATLERVRKLAEDWGWTSPDLRAPEAGTYILEVIKDGGQ